MMKLFDITEKYGKATYAYPFEPYVVPENFRGQPHYTYDLCIGCAACAIACPPNAIEVKLNGKTGDNERLVWEFDCGRCIFCGRCDEVCPTGAVALSDSFELAVKFDKDALIQRGELEVEQCACCGKTFTPKRLIAYALEKLKVSNLLPGRLEEAQRYLHICPSCKQNEAVETMIKGEEGKLR